MKIMEFKYKIELIFVGLHTQDTYLFNIYFILKYSIWMSNLFYMVQFIIKIFIILLVATSQIRNYLFHFLFNF